MKSNEIVYDISYANIEAALADFLFRMNILPKSSEVTNVFLEGLKVPKDGKLKLTVNIKGS